MGCDGESLSSEQPSQVGAACCGAKEAGLAARTLLPTLANRMTPQCTKIQEARELELLLFSPNLPHGACWKMALLRVSLGRRWKAGLRKKQAVPHL